MILFIYFCQGLKTTAILLLYTSGLLKSLNANSSYIFLAHGHCLFTLADDLLEEFRFLENCPPTPPLSQHFALSEK